MRLPMLPRWKLHGMREKYLLRLVAERWLPKEVAWRRKGMLAVMDKEVNYPESFDQGRKLLGRFSEAQRPTVA